MKKIIKKLFENIIILFLFFILLEVIYSKFILKEYPVKLFGFAFLIVGTGSMEPEIQIGEFILIKETSKYKSGDIITFKDKDEYLITHRIIDIKEKEVLTKGDNNDLEDEWIASEKIEGKVVFKSEILGNFFIYYLKPILFFYILFIVLKEILKIIYLEENVKNKEIK